jgi:GAF domain-containing protein
MIKDGAFVGALIMFREVVQPFDDREIALLQNFAAQAVIAMENARLLDDLRTRTDDLQQSLEYQTATSDVLKVISRSTFDLQPVLDTLAEAAARLCDAGYGAIFRRDGEVYRVATVFAFSPDTTEAAHKFQTYLEHHPLTVDRGSVTGRTVLAGHAVQVADTASDPEYTINEATSLGKLRTQLGVPLLREGEPIGVIVVARQRVEPFTERQIELVRTFAAQAVIAIENTRLITETREALEQQTATSEVLGVINSSPGDLRPVFDAMLEKAIALCEATFGTLWTYDGEHMHAAAVLGATPRYTEFLRAAPHSPSPVAHQPLLGGAPVVHIADVSAHESYHSGSALPNALVDLGGVRTLLAVPLRKDGALLGVFSIYRSEVRPFTDKQIALLQNFAAQAVIAMENARLITETREALEQQTATAEILGVISSSGTDVKPVFDAIVEHTIKLCDAEFTAVARYEDDGLLGLVATNNLSSEEAAWTCPALVERDWLIWRPFFRTEPGL